MVLFTDQAGVWGQTHAEQLGSGCTFVSRNAILPSIDELPGCVSHGVSNNRCPISKGTSIMAAIRKNACGHGGHA